ncbi:MAG: hypothetical protein OXQ29_26560, partial [Rhodospirillaceae bacterium]|nr:hypothetical protein [Rhodospirillaceae bacterium]
KLPAHWLKMRLLGHHHRAALVAPGEQREQHLRLVGTPLHVAEVVEQDRLKEVELSRRPRQVQVAFRAEQFLDRAV